ncbi:sugar transferase [Gracilimonas mengyeensis]|uniref:Undecaprenyl-phosphate glucose phosphotransferase n=1 Tax=Gracilimonas mengyeensis TaxID=1302730 RepID=A0A521CBF9_9BACT|nr:sugar transferase [Gracilimonas mengyeensis]SMO56734.1 Undecaprenyl-phosphate glucose phosphotransferase [Gracilimonas mengyeensis]
MLKLKRYREVIFTSILDFLIILASWFVFHSFYPNTMNILMQDFNLDFISGGLLVSLYWMVIFVVMGSYKKLYLVSRLDEFIKVLKASLLGSLILFFIINVNERISISDQRVIIIAYWATIFMLLALNRFVVRTVQRYYAQQGKGLHRTIIVGTGQTAKVAYDDLNRNKTLGMQVLGFIQVNGKAPDPDSGIEQEEVIGRLNDIESIIQDRQVQDILVALEPDRRQDLVEVISKVDSPDVSLKLLPDFYQLVSGLSKTNQIFGMPLVEISPEPMPLWEKTIKRAFDILVSAVVLVLTFPFLVMIGLAVRLSSPGPAIYRQERVGRNGRLFTIYKYRTMLNDAERHSGPTWATKDDPRVTGLGYWLRKLRIDEVPQLLNVLKGDMSLVGPRPERPHFVEQFSQQIPLYTRRLRVRPGITGWAQVKWKYDTSLDDVKEKTKFDLFYIENASLRMDAKILINTVITILKGKGQ